MVKRTLRDCDVVNNLTKVNVCSHPTTVSGGNDRDSSRDTRPNIVSRTPSRLHVLLIAKKFGWTDAIQMNKVNKN